VSTAATVSICMPTYNYGRYIRTALESIRSQLVDGVEVVVLDGGSTDGTQAIVEAFAAAWPAVRYFRQASRGGIDADMARSVELASGEYCWLLSADDALQPGALGSLLAALRGGNDIVLCNRTWCDAELKPVSHQAWLAAGEQDRVVDLSRREQLLRYIGDARSLGALFSFMSCIGFRRAAWSAVAVRSSVACYAHVARLFAMGADGARLRYVAAPLVLCRGGIDSFRAGGIASRLLIDLRGYRQLAQAIFPRDEALRKAFLAVMRREHPLRQWVRARLESGDAVQWGEVERELAGYGYTPLELRLIGSLGGGLSAVRSFVKGRPK